MVDKNYNSLVAAAAAAHSMHHYEVVLSGLMVRNNVAMEHYLGKMSHGENVFRSNSQDDYDHLHSCYDSLLVSNVMKICLELVVEDTFVAAVGDEMQTALGSDDLMLYRHVLPCFYHCDVMRKERRKKRFLCEH